MDLADHNLFTWIGWTDNNPFKRFKGIAVSCNYPIAVAWSKDKKYR